MQGQANEGQANPASERVTVKRLPKRAAYDRDTIKAILDEALICHVGFVVDGQPFVIPTICARVGDRLIIHGSAASRMLRGVRTEIPVCVTATLIDGLVLARSAFHHSMNYRSVVILGPRVGGGWRRRENRGAEGGGRSRDRRTMGSRPRARPRPSCAARPCSRFRSTKRRPRSGPAGRSTTRTTTRFRSGPASFRSH